MPTGFPSISLTRQVTALELEKKTSSAAISSSTVNGASTTGMPCSPQISRMCLRAMPGRIRLSQGAVCSTPSLRMCTLEWEHSVTRSPRWKMVSSQPASTARWLAITAGSRLIVLMLQCRKRVSSMVMQRYAP